MTDSKRRNISVWKKLCFAIVPAIFLVAVAEIALRVVDYQSPSADPYASFVTREPLFVERDGVMYTAEKRTRLFHPIAFERAKPSNAIRFITVGGSTTYGYHLSVPLFDCYTMRLSQQLEQELTSTIEPINCGGVGYASYRLLPVVQQCVGFSPDFVIVMMGNNEFLEPRYYADILDNASVGERVLQTSRFAQFASDIGHNLGWSKPQSEELGDWHGEYIIRDEEEIQHTLDHYKTNLQRIVLACQETNTPLILCTVPTNIRDWPPFESEPSEGTSKEEFKRQIDAATALLEKKQYDQCKQMCLKLIKQHPKAAIFHYLNAKCDDNAGDIKLARSGYVRARDLDGFPQRALPSFNDAIREIAKKNDIRLVDIEQIFKDNSADGLPGESLFLDNCHPNNKGHELIKDSLIKVVHEILGR